jgi:argininosuccinate lyase
MQPDAMSEQPPAKRTKLWQAGDGLHPLVEAYTVGEHFRIDGDYMVPFDVEASTAHAEMLHAIGILDLDELKQAKKGLAEVEAEWRAGRFKVTISQEDCHTAIEQFLTEKYGDVGKKIHTGRSRNDQSLTMLRLYMRSKLQEFTALTARVAEGFAVKAKDHRDVPMPGYTHMQKAMPTKVGIWLESFSHALQDSDRILKSTLALVNQNPLGSAAGFGINHLELDRKKTTELMNFDRCQDNVMYCGFSRGYFEMIVLQAINVPMVVASRFATDMMMFTQQETSFLSLPDQFVTGSSIMPQKKNYDLFEIMRANGKVFASLQQQIQSTIVGLGSGYHRDFQVTKKAFVEAVDLAMTTLGLLDACVPELRVNEGLLKAAMTEELFVTDEVYKRVAAGELFRDAYLAVKTEFHGKVGGS